MKVREESAWAKRPMWQKRLHGFASYMMAALAALICPVEADKAMYTALRDQFEDLGHNV
jgi:hypothetical protein